MEHHEDLHLSLIHILIFTNGDKLEFDKKGVWTEVNCKYSAVPVAVVAYQT